MMDGINQFWTLLDERYPMVSSDLICKSPFFTLRLNLLVADRLRYSSASGFRPASSRSIMKSPFLLPSIIFS